MSKLLTEANTQREKNYKVTLTVSINITANANDHACMIAAGMLRGKGFEVIKCSPKKI